MQLKKILITLAFLFGFGGVSYADNSTDAIEFMITGDLGFEKGGLEQVSFKDCLLTYSQSPPYSGRITVSHDFNKVKWKSAAFVGKDFNVSCSGTCTIVLPKKSLLAMMIAPDTVAFPIQTTTDRFTIALYDFQDQCKGSTSKY